MDADPAQDPRWAAVDRPDFTEQLRDQEVPRDCGCRDEAQLLPSAVLGKDVRWNGTADSVCSSGAGCHPDWSVSDVVNTTSTRGRGQDRIKFLLLGFRAAI